MPLREPCRLAVALVLLAAAAPLTGQEAVLSGRVVAADSTPIARAEVRLTLPEGSVRAVLTDSAGRYTLLLPGHGSFVARAAAFGYLPFTAAVVRPPGAELVSRDFRLSPRPVMLETVRVSARAVAPPRDRPTPAELGGRMEAPSLAVYPVDLSDFADVAALQPGAFRGPGGLSLAGQGPEQNGTTVDGASFSGGALPSEGVRSVGVFGTTYDVSRGRFSGGQVAATTIAGTNRWGASFSTHLDDPALRYGGDQGGLGGRPGRYLRASAGGGGAPVRDRFFVYGALDVSRRTSIAPGLEGLDAEALRTLNVAPDSARRLAEVAVRIGAWRPADGARISSSTSGSGLARLDYAFSAAHSLTARLDWRGTGSTGLGASPLRLHGAGGDRRSADGGLLLQHALGRGRWANELRAYASEGRTRVGGEDGLPAAAVRVSSTLPDGTTAPAILSFGGLAFAREESRALREVADDFRMSAGGMHQLRAGFVLQEERAAAGAAAQAGTFTFASLAELEAGRPAAYTRRLGGAERMVVRRSASAYLGDTWRPRRGIALIYGVRVEGSRFGGRDALPAALDSLGGTLLATPPLSIVATPRAGFHFVSRGRGQWTVEGGVGGFAGPAPLAGLAQPWGQTGTEDALLACVGPAAPAPDWAGFAADPGALPTACADGAPAFASRAPGVVVFAPDHAIPRTWRATLGANGRLGARWELRVDLLAFRGTHLPSGVLRNLTGAPAFTLPAEGSRPVLAPPSAIDPATGEFAPAASRASRSLGPVVELGSRGESRGAQLTAQLIRPIGKGLLSVAYTGTRASVLGGGVAAPGAAFSGTAGDPNRLEWAPAPFSAPHVVQGMLRRWSTRRLSFGAVAQLRAGVRFTPLVGQDVNGDGAANDRAFVFDPRQVADPALAAGMERLLASAPGGARACLRVARGTVAAPGACRTPWSASLHLRADYTAGPRSDLRRLAFTFTASNVSAGLDHLLHGPERLRGWGQHPFPDATLLQVRGFDPAARAFVYEVNPRFGSAMSGGALRIPFRVTLQARATLGADPRFQPVQRMLEMGAAGARESVRAELAGRIRNLAAELLQLDRADTTAPSLTASERARIQAIADSLAPALAAIVERLTDLYTARGPETALRGAKVREAAEHAEALDAAAREGVREVLGAGRWERLPAWLVRPLEVVPPDGRSPTFRMEGGP